MKYSPPHLLLAYARGHWSSQIIAIPINRKSEVTMGQNAKQARGSYTIRWYHLKAESRKPMENKGNKKTTHATAVRTPRLEIMGIRQVLEALQGPSSLDRTTAEHAYAGAVSPTKIQFR